MLKKTVTFWNAIQAFFPPLTKSKWEASHLCHFLSAVYFPACPQSVCLSSENTLSPRQGLSRPTKSPHFCITAPHYASALLIFLALASCGIQYLVSPQNHHLTITSTLHLAFTVKNMFVWFFYFISSQALSGWLHAHRLSVLQLTWLYKDCITLSALHCLCALTKTHFSSFAAPFQRGCNCLTTQSLWAM